MLLRASSEAIGQDADLRATVGRGDGGLEHGALLTRLAEAATRGDPDLDTARAAVLDALGAEQFVEACATVGIFNGLVRTADAIGIPLDQGTLDASSGFRAELGLNDYTSAGSTDLSAARESGERDVQKLFR